MAVAAAHGRVGVAGCPRAIPRVLFAALVRDAALRARNRVRGIPAHLDRRGRRARCAAYARTRRSGADRGVA